MVEWIRDMRKENVMSMKDEKGNTVLHLATWKNQRQHLTRENPLILDNIVPFDVENPLYIASSTGQTDFVKHILRVKPDFPKEVNQEGLTPMHMAAGNDHVEIMKERILVDSKLFRLEGREKRTPLHYASANGQVKVISEMLLCCPDCIGDVTVQRETALHLAVKNNQFKATTTLIEFVKEMKKEDIMNLKDEQGNTALHLAVWKKQRQMIELLLDSEATRAELSEVNTINHSGLTALDVLLCFPSEAGDREILQILQADGATRAVCIPSSATTRHQSSDDTPMPRARRSKFNNLVDYFKFKRGRDSPSEAHGTRLVIACLVATATFQVGVSPPGGVWQETFTPDPNSSSSSSNNNSDLAMRWKQIRQLRKTAAIKEFLSWKFLRICWVLAPNICGERGPICKPTSPSFFSD